MKKFRVCVIAQDGLVFYVTTYAINWQEALTQVRWAWGGKVVSAELA